MAVLQGDYNIDEEQDVPNEIHNIFWVQDTSGNEAHHVHQGPSVIVKVQKHAGHLIRQWIISA